MKTNNEWKIVGYYDTLEEAFEATGKPAIFK